MIFFKLTYFCLMCLGYWFECSIFITSNHLVASWEYVILLSYLLIFICCWVISRFVICIWFFYLSCWIIVWFSSFLESYHEQSCKCLLQIVISGQQMQNFPTGTSVSNSHSSNNQSEGVEGMAVNRIWDLF